MPEAGKVSSLPYDPLTDSAVHLCIDMQRDVCRADAVLWHVPWMKRVSPMILRIARVSETNHVTRFIPRCVQRTRQGLDGAITSAGVTLLVNNWRLRSSALLPEFLEFISPPLVFDNISTRCSQSHTFTLSSRTATSLRLLSPAERRICVSCNWLRVSMGVRGLL